jgi:uncharacterized damage-inducible protein DinB
MNIAEAYDYLVRARRDLWAMLDRMPDEVLSRPLLNGAKLHCIKDLLFHIANNDSSRSRILIIDGVCQQQCSSLVARHLQP